MFGKWKLKIVNYKSGFTLLELLVVIAIIGILVSLGVVSYTTAQRRSRDAKRIGDMKSIQSAFEQYRIGTTAYSATCLTMATSFAGGILPTDPKTGYAYPYNTVGAGAGCSNSPSRYCICALLETTGDGNANAPTGSQCNFIASGNYYCVQNLQ